MRALLTLALLLFASPAWAAVAIDASSGNTILNNGVSTYSMASLPTIAGANRYLIVACGSNFSTTPCATGVTHNSVAMTNIGSVDGTGKVYELWGLVAPATGSNAIAFAGLDNSGLVEYAFCAASFTGVHQTVPIGTVVLATGDSATTSVTVTTAANGLNFIGAVGITDLAVGAGVTEITGCKLDVSSLGGIAGTSTQNTNTFTQTSNDWATGGVPLQPASAVVPQRRRIIQQ